LTKRLGDFNKYIAVAGFRNVKIKDVNHFLERAQREIEGTVQFFDAKAIASQQHLYFAALNALKAFEKNLNISNSLSIEVLLYASAQRQIRKAVGMLGIKPHSSQVAVLVIAETKRETDKALEAASKLISGERDDNVLELTEEKFEGVKTLFGVSDLEVEAKLRKEGLKREALVDLVIEHVALLATQN
jgi:tRNA threonylcarbamoyladenosine modification (KEOPS) complex Cgi121 subunit